MFEFFVLIFRGVARSRVSMVGAIISAVIAPVLMASVLLDFQGVVQNPYFGFLIYLVMGPLLALGLILMLTGLLFRKKEEDIGLFTIEYIMEQMRRPGRYSRVRRLIYLSTFLTLFTVFVVGVISYTGFNYTDTVGFCAGFCHRVMEPEYLTYLNSPHSRIPCVDCHIGSSAGWFTRAKISGFRQLVATVRGRYPRPIETPVSGLRPEQETCERCHRPEMFHGDKLYVREEVAPDRDNTRLKTVLLMRVGGGEGAGGRAHGIHWHVSPDHRIEYRSTDASRMVIDQVRMTDSDGRATVFKAPSGWGGTGEWRVMDCIDCHNRPTHVFRPPGRALDEKILSGRIPELPFVKKVTLEAITGKYRTTAEARRVIFARIKEAYSGKFPPEEVRRVAEGAFEAYSENVFPEMNIGWNTYTSFIGHDDGNPGCFRCHDGEHRSPDGRVISNDCELCHLVLADGEKDIDIRDLLRTSGKAAGGK